MEPVVGNWGTVAKDRPTPLRVTAEGGKILLWVSVLMSILKKDELGAGIEQKGDAYEN